MKKIFVSAVFFVTAATTGLWADATPTAAPSAPASTAPAKTGKHGHKKGHKKHHKHAAAPKPTGQ